VVTKTENPEDAFTFTLLLHLTARTARLKDRCTASLDEYARGLTKAQIERCTREVARCVGRTTLPIQRCSKGHLEHIAAVDVNTARDIVLQGACASPAAYDLVRGLAAYIALKAVGHRLTEQAGDMYFDGIEARVASDLAHGPIGARHSARLEAANALPTRRRRAALAELERDVDRDYEEAIRTLNEAIELELATRTATALRSPECSTKRATAHLN
jgi:hypothetical protein